MSTQSDRKVRIVCISDTHSYGNGQGFKLPDGDVLIHAGDITNQGDIHECERAAKWLREADFKTKIVIAGNHDLTLDTQYCLKHASGWKVEPTHQERCRDIMTGIPGLIYLEHESCTIDINGHALTVFGSPYSIDSGKQNWAFQYNPEDAESLWSTIPQDVDILVTHTPPAGILDESTHWPLGGCPSLRRRVDVIRPLLHVFGHHHEGRGVALADWSAPSGEQPYSITSWQDPGAENRKQSIVNLTRSGFDGRGRRTIFVNASIMKNSWSRTKTKQFNKPIVISCHADLLANH